MRRLISKRPQYYRYWRQLLLALSLCVGATSSYAKGIPCYSLQADLANRATDLTPWLGYRASSDDLSAPIRLSDSTEAFKPLVVDGQTVRLDGTDYWFEICISNTTKAAKNLQLVINPPVLNNLGFYPPEQLGAPINTGFIHPFRSRGNADREFNFDINLAANSSQIYHLSVRHPNMATMGINADLWTRENYRAHSARDEAVKFIHLGIFVALFFYHLFLYAMTREKTLIFFVVSSSFGFLTFYGANGFVFQQILSEYPQWNVTPIRLIGPMTTISVVLYITHFLHLPETMPNLTRKIYWVLGLSGAAFVVLWPWLQLYIPLMVISSTLVMPLFVLAVSVYCYFNNNKSSLYVLIAILIPCIIYLLFAMGITRFGSGLEFALTLSMLLFSFGMGHQFNQSKKEKELAQQVTLLQLAENIRLKEDHNAELENRIKARTEEIEDKTLALEQQALQLKAVDKMKSDFFSNISHEFRTPLTLIQGPLEHFVTNSSGDFPVHYQTGADIALRNTKQLSKLIEQLLELAKIEGSRQVIRVAEMDICQFAREQAAQFTSLSDSRKIQLSINVPAQPILLYFDIDKMQKIINNLISNALKFTDPGGEVNLIIRDSDLDQESTGSDAYVELVVVDTGSGISDRDIPHVFDRFYQGSARDGQLSGTGTGTGIGLALANELVTLHGGSIQLRSALHEGSTFTVSFPKGCDHFLQEELRSQHAVQAIALQNIPALPITASLSSQSGDSSGQQHCVLIVDDNQDMRTYLQQSLIQRYNLLQANNGVEGLTMAQQFNPDLIISDVMMPEMDGISFLQEIRRDPSISHTPVILLTALATQDDRFKGLRAQADDYLIKPFNVSELTIRIDNLISRNKRIDRSEAMVELRPQNPADVNSSEDQETTFMSKLNLQIETHMMDENFDVDYLASLMFMSKATLYRHLEAQASTSPGMLIRERRMLRARELFHAEDSNYRSIEQVAAAVGIKKASYFSRLYRKVLNEEPGFPEKVS